MWGPTYYLPISIYRSIYYLAIYLTWLTSIVSKKSTSGSPFALFAALAFSMITESSSRLRSWLGLGLGLG